MLNQVDRCPFLTYSASKVKRTNHFASPNIVQDYQAVFSTRVSHEATKTFCGLVNAQWR